MNREEKWLLPEGVDEILPPQAAIIERLRRTLLDLYDSWGYELVFPPLIEYLESLLNGAGLDLEHETFKITDQLSGRLMGLRPDITPQVARMDAHSLKIAGPARLCYCSTSVRTRAAQPGGSRIPYQIGVELFGHAGVESDLEVISLMLDSMKSVAITPWVLDLGHVGVYRALVKSAGLQPEHEQQLHDILLRKAARELQDWLDESAMGSLYDQAFVALLQLAGEPKEVLAKARQQLPAVAQSALDELDQLIAAIQQVAPGLRIHLDLGELRGYHYHTGSLFALYIQGISEPVAKGGRYDHIGEVYGRARPATGFSADLKLLAAEQAPISTWAILAEGKATDPDFSAEVARLRNAGERVIQVLPGLPLEQQTLSCDRRLEKQSTDWVLLPINKR